MSSNRREGTAEDLRRFVENWNAARKEGGGTDFGAVSLEVLKICERTLEGVRTIDGTPAPVQGSAEATALRVKKDIEATKRHIAEGRSDWAARTAWDALRVYVDAYYQLNIRADLEKADAFLPGQNGPKQKTVKRIEVASDVAKRVDDGPNYRKRLANEIWSSAQSRDKFGSWDSVYRWLTPDRILTIREKR